ncbi:MAG TPA: ArsA-related P-loop ATPase [Polyangiaceae bacterium]|jgi:anion-transporting  ArsA/GET3 family ATPase|nr:ArsA-related P-loop ATPase [Polyangiaceae bacterium]
MTIEKLLQRRVLLVTGKGGVGKTTVAASLGRAAAAAGKRVLVAEISYESPRDPEEAAATTTSPLAGAFGQTTFADEPRLIERTLYGARLSPLAGHLAFLRDTLPVRLLADAAMKSAAVRRFFHAAPTLAELGIVYRLLGLVKEKWDVIVCDLPATGHALALAQVPQTLADVLRAGPIHSAAQEGLALFRDPERTTSVLVTLPEPLPVSEALELHEGLHKLSVDCSLVVLNRVPPNPFTAEERAAVERIVPDRMRMLGARRLPRIDRATTAHDRLARELRLPVRILHEMDADVVTRIARELGGAR